MSYMISSNFKYYYFIGFLTTICLIFFANSILLFLFNFCSSIRFSRYALFNFGASSKLILTILISYSLLITNVLDWLIWLPVPSQPYISMAPQTSLLTETSGNCSLSCSVQHCCSFALAASFPFALMSWLRWRACYELLSCMGCSQA